MKKTRPILFLCILSKIWGSGGCSTKLSITKILFVVKSKLFF